MARCKACPVQGQKMSQETFCQICVLRVVMALPESHKAILYTLGEKWAERVNLGLWAADPDSATIAFRQQVLLDKVVSESHQPNVVRHSLTALESMGIVESYMIGRTKMVYVGEFGRAVMKWMISEQLAREKAVGRR